MKRTKVMNYNRFRKVHTFWKYSALFMVVGGSLILTGCDDAENVSVYNTIQDCERSAANDAAKNQCALDYQNALSQNAKVAPKYYSQKDCEDEFGTGQCNSQSVTSNTVSTANGAHSSFMWFPLMSGYSSSSTNYPSQPLYSSKKYNSPMYGKFVDSTGTSFGSFTSKGTASVPKSSLAPKATTTTTTRGGFGSTVNKVSSHSSSSFNSHSSGSSHSFGG
jgi:uncharacterized protein YgiB involved in biofilm formation